MAHSVLVLMVVLENLASGGRRGKSYACPGAALRVAAWELLVWSPSIRRLKAWADEGPEAAQWRAWQCPIVPGSLVPGIATMPGMAAQWWGWPHRAESDGGDVLRWFDVTAPSWVGARQMAILLSKVSPSSFEGCDVEAVREWAT
jgi:hypothetical protein